MGKCDGSDVVEHCPGQIEQANTIQTISWSRNQTPAFHQTRNLRWAVDFDIPKHGDSACQAHPLTRT